MSNIAAQYRNWDTKKAPGVYVMFEREIIEDDDNHRPDKNNEGFWPSLDPKTAGWIGRNDVAEFDRQQKAAEERLAAWERGDWYYVGVRVRATITLIHSNGHAIAYELFSAGCWGVESDAGDYLNDLFDEERSALLADIKVFGEAKEN